MGSAKTDMDTNLDDGVCWNFPRWEKRSRSGFWHLLEAAVGSSTCGHMAIRGRQKHSYKMGVVAISDLDCWLS